jgi:hypothetical protein
MQVVSAHTLEWGVLPDSQFLYVAKGQRQDIGVVDLEYTLTFLTLDTIPTTIDFPDTQPRTSVQMINFEDSSSLDMGNDVSSMCYGSFSAVPIDDWVYMSTIVEAYSDPPREVVSFQNSTHWGYSNNGEWPDVRVLQTTIYLKSNGVMVYYSGSRWSFGEQTMLEDVTITQVDSFPSTATTDTTSTTTTTTSSTTSTTTTGQGPTNLDPQLKLTAVGASATVTFGILGFAFKSDLIKEKKHKVSVVIIGIMIFAAIASGIWFLL